jgi:Ca-activated chloride channel family protein
LSHLDLRAIRFEEPRYLWLLVGIGLLLMLWGWQLVRRRQDVARLRRRRRLALGERFPVFGGLLFWLCLLIASACSIAALARPHAPVSLVRRAGIDLVVLQDGSASMHVRDVKGDRWQRSMAFLRALGESLEWKDDRMALALFAHIAAPQVRLTSDPNTFFFFLDHLDRGSPFRLEDDTTWDTNIELGIHWGIRMVERDEELHGPSPNAKAFVLVSDGQAWSGEVARALAVATGRHIPLFVVGVGTIQGGLIPEPSRSPAPQAQRPPPPRLVSPQPPEPPPAPIRSSLDRESLQTIALRGGGQYFELDRESDRDIANTVIDDTRQRAGVRGNEERAEDLHWLCLLAAAGFACVGLVFLRDRREMWMGLTGAAASLIALWRLGL